MDILNKLNKLVNGFKIISASTDHESSPIFNFPPLVFYVIELLDVKR